MSRAKFQVLIIPYRITESGALEFAITRRNDMDVWQFLSGGGEGSETPVQAAKREANEKGGIPYDSDLIHLDSTASIPVHNFAAHKEWGDEVYVIPEFCFGGAMKNRD